MIRRGRAVRAAEIAAALLILPLLAGSVVLARLDPAVVKARVVQEVRRATGRDLAIGSMRLTLVPDLTIDADDVALTNPPGFSRAALLTAGHVHARVALLPLLGHRVVIRAIALTAPDLKLEQRADGAANWRFARTAAMPGPVQTDPKAGTMRLDSLTVLDVAIVDGALAWAVPGSGGAVRLPAARLREVNASSTMHLSARAVTTAGVVSLEGRFGGQTHLWNPADRSRWPVSLRLASDAGAVRLDGTITAPRELAGYDLAVHAEGPDLGRLAAIWPPWQAPRLRDVRLDTRLIDYVDGGHVGGGAAGVDVPSLTLVAGPSDLSASVPGLMLDRLAIEAPNIDGGDGTLTNRVSVAGTYAASAMSIDGTLGPVGRLFGRGQVTARAPIRLDAAVAAAGARLAVQGQVAPTGDWGGTDLSVRGSIPDLAALSALAGRALPPLHDIELSGAVRSVRGDLVLSGARLSNPLIDVGVDGTARLSGRPLYAGRVTVARLDLDALEAMPMGGGPAAEVPASPALPLAPAGPATLIPDRPIDFGGLRSRDVDLTLTIGHLVRHGAALDDIATHVVLAGGRLNVDPFSARLGGVPVAFSLSVDAARDPPALALEARAAGLDAAQMLALAGWPAAATGGLAADISLAGAGTTAHAIAGSLQGRFGAALTGGRIDNALLTSALAALVPATRLGLRLPRTGSSAVDCLATRLDLHDGVGVSRAFVLDLDRLTLTAEGAIDFGQESVALRLRPVLLLGRTQLVLPSRVDGLWRAPLLSLEPAGGGRSASSIAVDLIGGRGRSAAALLAGVAPADGALAEGGGAGCAVAIGLVHDHGEPAAATGPAAVAAPPLSPRQRAAELLRRLFGRVR